MRIGGQKDRRIERQDDRRSGGRKQKERQGNKMQLDIRTRGHEAKW